MGSEKKMWVFGCGVCMNMQRDKKKDKANVANDNSKLGEGRIGVHCTFNFSLALIFFKNKVGVKVF